MAINNIYKTIEKVQSAKDYIDLSDSNFPANGYKFPLSLLKSEVDKYLDNFIYQPDSNGLLKARQAIEQYYQNTFIKIAEENVFLTASTSESYQLIFQVLKQINSHKNKFNILLPNPGYPLFEYLAKYNQLSVRYYDLNPNNNWQPDLSDIDSKIDENTLALVLISPNNPTGSVLTKSSLNQIVKLVSKFQIPIIHDEVFSEFINEDYHSLPRIKDRELPSLCFNLNGISKMFGLPDWKLAWLTVRGNDNKLVEQVVEELEIANDTFLNANYLIQSLLPSIFVIGTAYNQNWQKELNQKRKLLQKLLKIGNAEDFIVETQGGIHAFLSIILPKVQLSEETFIIKLLNEYHVNFQPGYFYDYEINKYYQPNSINLVFSLLKSEADLTEGISRLLLCLKKYQN